MKKLKRLADEYRESQLTGAGTQQWRAETSVGNNTRIGKLEV